MVFSKYLVVFVCLAGAAVSALPAAAATNCTASQQAAVECFVANAVATDLTKPRYGMTLAQFQAYGVAVSQILQTHQTYLVLVGVSSAVADAMPPTNKNGSSNQAAQNLAVEQIVDAVSSMGIAVLPAHTTLTDMQRFTLDITSAMNDNDGVLQLLTPGVSLRVIDSYILTATSGGKVNWSEVETSLSNAVNTFIKSGLMKLPAGITEAKVNALALTLAHIIYEYKVSTGRASLS